jgi:pyruvate formate lyase activating enzyme
MRKAGVHVEVTTLVVPGVNDRPEQLRTVAETLAGVGTDIPWHVSRFFPAWKLAATPPTPLSVLRQAEEFGRAAGIRHIHLGNV